MIVSAIAVPHPPLILPSIGKGEEKAIAKTSNALREAIRFLANSAPEAVVIISPHATNYQDYIHISPGKAAEGDFSRFGQKGVKAYARYDEALAAAIEREALRLRLSAGTRGERDCALDHGTLIPLIFMQEALPNIPILRIGLSGMGAGAHYRMGQCIRLAASAIQRRVAVIASGDLSHKLLANGPYGYAPEGPELDGAITHALKTGDFQKLLGIPPILSEKGADCGLSAFIMMAGALDGVTVEAELLSYEGTFGVGYAVATFLPGEERENRRFLELYERSEREAAQALRANEDAHRRLARMAVEAHVLNGKSPALEADLPTELLKEKAGVFVTLYKHGRLRGCIGTTAPTTNSVAQEILQNAVSAAAHDPRFDPVTSEELDMLEVKVDVLLPPEPIASMEALDVRRYGVIVTSGRRRGLLLPDLDGVDTVDQQVEIARQKAGISPNEPVTLERFSVVRH